MRGNSKLCVLLLVALQSTRAQQAQLTSQLPSAGQQYARLVYEPGTLSDAQFALLARTIAADTPIPQWPVIRVRKGVALLSIVDRSYDFFVSTPGPFHDAAKPKTARALVEIIRDANDLKSDVIERDGYLSIPPVPVRPRHRGKTLQEYAYFDTTTVDQPTVHLWSSVAPLEWDNHWNVANFERLGARSTSKYVISMKSASAYKLAAADVGDVALPERLSIELLDTTPCLPDYPPSPYLALAREKLAASLPAMTKAAASRPLVLIDHDFKEGHGLQVRRVVDKLLEDLQVPALGRFVLNFDLNPRNAPNVMNDHPLIKAMLEYSEFLKPLNISAETQEAEGLYWIVHPDALQANGRVVPIAPFILQSAVATQLRANAWLSLSWRGDTGAQAMPTGLDTLIKTQAAFVVAAAGNDKGLDIVPDRDPQRKAAGASEFVNVTHGTSAGDLCGNRSGSAGERVHLLARGVSTNAKDEPVYGSSFAAPVVALAAWLRHLSEGIPAASMRKALYGGSSFLPWVKSRGVEANGVFDPARFLSGIGPHFIDSQGAVVPLSAMTLNVGACGTFAVTSADAETTQDLVIFEEDGRFKVARRQTVAHFPHVKMADVCETDFVSFQATLRSGEVNPPMTTLKDFVTNVRQVHF